MKKKIRFLMDVFVCSLGAYGGPETHIGVFIEHLAVKRKYVSEEDVLGYMAICGLLPGPTSTQTIVALGYQYGGPLLGGVTLLVWAIPALIVMGALGILYARFQGTGSLLHGFRLLGPVAVGFVCVAAWRISRKVTKDALTLSILLLVGLITYFFRTPWVFPLVLLAGGMVTLCRGWKPGIWKTQTLSPDWLYLWLFAMLILITTTGALLTDVRLFQVAESFCRYGYMVFGGGQVIVPLMIGELVTARGYLSSDAFLAGYGLVQGLPGPMFSFSAYAGAISMQSFGILHQISGALIAGFSIFLPGILLLFGVFPVWRKLQGNPAIALAMRGVHAAAGGLLISAATILLQQYVPHVDALCIIAASSLILLWRIIPSPVLILLALCVGFIL